jgi:hypothetical protein
MAFPAATVASPPEFPAFAFDGSAVAAGSALAGAGEDPEAGSAAAEETCGVPPVAAGSALTGAGDGDPEGAAAEAADVPPRLSR